MSTKKARGKILVVEDDAFNLRMYARVLQSAGFEVQLATNGEEGLKQLRADPADIVVSDLRMPGMDGFGLLRNMRADPKLALVPVVVLTALGQESDRARGFGLGADAYLSKPIKFDTLVQEVEAALLRAQSTRAGMMAAPTVPALAGRLDVIGPAVVLTLLASTGKTGTIQFTRGASRGAIRLRGGQPVDATLGNELQGLAAAVSILGWSTGEFELSEGEVNGPDTVGLSVNDLLVEATRRR